MLLHRFIYEYYIEEIPEDLIIRHTCDNVLCINPKHLKTGTLKDNARDMVVRGRASTGERNGFSKLTDNEVDEIRDLYRLKIFNQTELGNTYGVSQRHISNIVRHINRST